MPGAAEEEVGFMSVQIVRRTAGAFATAAALIAIVPVGAGAKPFAPAAV